MAEPVSAIPTGGDKNDLVDLADVKTGGEVPMNNPETSSALDELLKQSQKPADSDEPTEEDKAAAEKAAADEAAAKEKAAAEKAAADEAAAKEKAKTQTPEEKAAAEKAAADEAAAKEKAGDKTKDKYDDIELPPHTSRKASESFGRVKEIARQAEAESLKTITQLNEKVATLEAELKKGLPPETAKELDELRNFRAKVDVEADPKFKEWDSQINDNVEGIYKKLLETGAGTPELIADIKKMGGPAEVDWDKIADKLPAPLKRYIDGKLFENEQLKERRAKAIEAAKANATEYLKTRAADLEKGGEVHRAAVQKEVEGMIPQFAWFKEQAATEKSTPEEKKSIESHNKLLKEIRTSIADAQADDSPEMKAILVMGFAQLQKVRADHEALKASSAAEKTRLETELKAANDMLEKIKKSSTGRLRESSAPAPGGETATKPPGHINLNEDGGSALDRHLAEVRAGK